MSQTAVKPDDVRLMINTGGPTLVNLMRKATADRLLANATFSEWEITFLTDVAAKAAKFRDKLTPKQEAKAKQILLKDGGVELLVHLLTEELTIIANTDLPASTFENAPPAPAVNPYAADPMWGAF